MTADLQSLITKKSAAAGSRRQHASGVRSPEWDTAVIDRHYSR